MYENIENHMVQGNYDLDDYYCPNCGEVNPCETYSVNDKTIGCENCVTNESQSYLECAQTCCECGCKLDPGSEHEELERPDYYKIGKRYYCPDCMKENW